MASFDEIVNKKYSLKIEVTPWKPLSIFEFLAQKLFLINYMFFDENQNVTSDSIFLFLGYFFLSFKYEFVSHNRLRINFILFQSYVIPFRYDIVNIGDPNELKCTGYLGPFSFYYKLTKEDN
jgi:hypothetical protein